MNMPVVQQQAPQLPAHLMNRSLDSSLTADALGGLSSGAVHKISIEGRRWKLQDPQGQEFQVPTFHLDVIIVGVNPHVSKTFYASKWVPGQDQKAPDCWSDNGVGPSSRAVAPQCGTCAACPNNAWGSRVSELGSQVKACSDSKKLAVVLADNPTGAVYQLRVPADSLKNLATIAKGLSQQKMGLEFAVMRLEFDPNVPHPKIVFTAVSYVNEQQIAAVDDLKGTEDVSEVTNVTDVPRPATAQIPQQQPVAVPQVHQPVPMPAQPMMPPVAMPQAPQFVQPQPVAPVAAQPAAFNPMAPAAAAAGVAAPAPKKRRTKTQVAAEAAAATQVQPLQAPMAVPQQPPVFAAPPGLPAKAAPHPVMPHPVMPQMVMAQPAGVVQQQPQLVAPPVQMPPMPAFLQRQPDAPGAVPAAAAVPIAPAPTDAALDNLLGKAMGG